MLTVRVLFALNTKVVKGGGIIKSSFFSGHLSLPFFLPSFNSRFHSEVAKSKTLVLRLNNCRLFSV